MIGDDPDAPDPNAQSLEDVACIIFLARYLADFTEKQDSNKVVEILRETWAKMSPLGRRAALALPLGGALKELLASALADEAAGGQDRRPALILIKGAVWP